MNLLRMFWAMALDFWNEIRPVRKQRPPNSCARCWGPMPPSHICPRCDHA